MRDLINIITETAIEGKGGFILDPALNPDDYIISPSFRGVSKWKARVLTGNNGGEHLGEMQDVGYVMISKTRNTIIPIARDDEHHMGNDLLYDLASGDYFPRGTKKQNAQKKLNINPSDYYPVWCHGRNYIYDKREIPDLLNVIAKYLRYGGQDGTLVGSNDYNGKQMSLVDFIESGGDMNVEPGQLASHGKQMVNLFTDLSNVLVQIGMDPDTIQARKAFTESAKVIRIVLQYAYELDVGIDYMNKLKTEVPTQLKELQKSNDIQGLHELMFGFDGIKNTIHMVLKKTRDEIKKSGGNPYSARTLKAFWGDLDLAIDMLARI